MTLESCLEVLVLTAYDRLLRGALKKPRCGPCKV